MATVASTLVRAAAAPKDEEEEEEQSAEWELCMICDKYPPDTRVLPCCHKVVCASCIPDLREHRYMYDCVECHKTIRGISYVSGEEEMFHESDAALRSL